MQPFEFVHIQKTGGSSVRAALGLSDSPTDKHWTAAEKLAAMGAAEWGKRFSFTIVRNPWDRLVSWWADIDAARNQPPQNLFRHYVIDRASTFEEFILLCGDTIHDPDGAKCVHRDQLSYLTDDTGAELVDFVGRFENIKQDVRVIGNHIGRRIPTLPRLNTASRRPDYRSYYTDETRYFVAASHVRDIARFGYSF